MTLHVAPEGSVAGGGWLQGFSVSGHAIHSKQPDKQRGSSCTPGGGLLGGRLDPASGTPGRSCRVPLGPVPACPASPPRCRHLSTGRASCFGRGRTSGTGL